MQKIPVTLSAAERREVKQFRSGGIHGVREITRAHILASLDREIADTTIAAVLGVSRAAIWRTRSAYQEKGLKYALHDAKRPGAPRQYQAKQEAEVAALACSPPPEGRQRWTVSLLTASARAHPEMREVSRETIRRWLKKTSLNRGAG